jgi:hypothetical protein
MTKNFAEYLLPPPVESEYTVIRPKSALAWPTFRDGLRGTQGDFTGRDRPVNDDRYP